MEESGTGEADDDIQTQQILLAASQHDLPQLGTLLRNGSASVQDPETGITPLHAAIAACEPSSPPAINGGLANGVGTNGNHSDEPDEFPPPSQDEVVNEAAQTVKFLLEQGAIWNDVDKNNETPGCLALKLGVNSLYDLMVDAGVRAEMLLNRLDEYEQLADDVSIGGEQDDGEDVATTAEPAQTSTATEATGELGMSNDDFLRASLYFQNDRILDESQNGVMMAWETDIMKRTVDLLIPTEGLRVLNIGHGMGIIDTFFQRKAPCSHHIIEAHPEVLLRMRREGWYNKSNVTIHEGKWQDLAPKIMEDVQMFDAIYFDTFAEDYKALRKFFNDLVLGLLEDGGKWGFFNGLGADRQICYDVYRKVVEMDLFEAGFDTEWETIEIPDLERNDEWRGLRRRYWTLKEYKLPICSFTG